jgi:hypothetical protein
MGLRVKLGGGFSYGRTGLRYGTRIGKAYVNVGRSGSLISAGPFRYWAPGGRSRTPGSSVALNGQCLGTTQAGDQCTNSATQGLVCRRHLAQAEGVAAAMDQQAEVEADPPAGADVEPAGSAPSAFTTLVCLGWGGVLIWGLYTCLTNPANDMATNVGGAVIWAVFWCLFTVVALVVFSFLAGVFSAGRKGAP